MTVSEKVANYVLSEGLFRILISSANPVSACRWRADLKRETNETAPVTHGESLTLNIQWRCRLHALYTVSQRETASARKCLQLSSEGDAGGTVPRSPSERSAVVNPLECRGNCSAIRSWYTGVGPSPLRAVPNVTAHPSTATVPITVLLSNDPLLCGFNVAIKG